MTNKLKKLVSANGIEYYPLTFKNAYNNWIIAYKSLNKNYLCYVCIKQYNEPLNANKNLGFKIGYANNAENAIDMINKYIEQYESI